jgi:DNA-binding LacI/PurR family transcriptional regulator
MNKRITIKDISGELIVLYSTQIIGFSDNPVQKSLAPEISYISQPVKEIAEASFNTLKNIISGSEKEIPEKQISNTHLNYN